MDAPESGYAPQVLIVDDDLVVRSLMRAVLENAGFQVIEASDGEEACRRCEEHRPELIVADVVMPGMDGFALCGELRRRPEYAYVPILMATGLDDVDSISQAYEAGATDFISKPINWVILSHRVRYMLRAGRAVGELHQNQQRLIAAKEAAETANRAKTNFLAQVSHELRTPLNAIIGFSTLMRDIRLEALADKYVEYSGMIVDSGTHLLAIINDILDLAKAEANTLGLAEEEIDIPRAVAHFNKPIVEMAQKAGIDYRIELGETLPSLYADSAKLKKILVNLLSNAVKFTPEGGSVRLIVGRDETGLAFRVEDTGIGIAEDKLPVALEPFGQIDTGLARKYEGVGLGLPLAKRLVELHGGTLAIASKPGQGTVVTAHFPANRLDESTQARAQRQIAS
jgi:signal transduction histidine kinase